ncbi:prepilin-type N-terminal cleavage/methylation domain-containing protein [bacterium]|nr:prepilin-type N-terminal cleavage/methylation domain-containing protein [bacterium]
MIRLYRRAISIRPSQRRRGFTLIEMLIAVTLVLLMMVLFAEIFGLASESMTLQQAIADGDQQVRSLTTVLRSDLQKRTNRTIVPFDFLEDPNFAGVPFADRQGYFYISLNDPSNATDNLLQFTVRSTIIDENSDETPYYGRSSGLVQRFPALTGSASANVRANPQQPEHDDGELAMNFTTSSTAAEIAYFMRGSRLYRRVALIRDPLLVSGTNSPQPRLTYDTATPGSLGTPIEFMRQNMDPAVAPVVQTLNGQYLRYDPTSGAVNSDDYWLDFDHSAYQVLAEVPSGSGTFLPDGARIVGTQLLNNALSGDGTQALALTMTRTYRTDSSGGPTTFFGIPRATRFGFDQSNGISREFSHSDPAQNGFWFLGRFTLEEMSHTDFNFPQNPSSGSNVGGNGNPNSYLDFPAAVDAGAFPDGVVDEFTGGDRRGQDLLLSNVHEFEIDVWDDAVGRFVSLGHSQTWSEDRNGNGSLDPGEDLNGNGSIDVFPGDYNLSRNRQLAAGFVRVPGDPAAWSVAPFDQWIGRTFDSWHRLADSDGDALTTGDLVPPAYRAMTYYPPASPYGPYANRGAWLPSTPGTPTNYSPGGPSGTPPPDIVFPLGLASPQPTYERSVPADYSFYYVCTKAGTSWPTEDVNGNGMLDPTEDLNNNGVLDMGEDANGNGVLDLGEDRDGDGVIDTNEPQWPTKEGAKVVGRIEDRNQNGVLDAGEDLNFNGVLDPPEPDWIAVRNVRPLRAVRLRVRFLHESSGRIRQVSIVHSLIDDENELQ